MTENEKEITVAIEHLKARNMSAKHIDMAIQALEKQIKLEEQIEHFKQCCHVNYDKTSIVGLLKKFLIN